MSEMWNLLVQGDIIGAVTTTFTSRFEPVPSLFFAIILFVGLTLVYLKTENFGTVGVVGLIIAGNSLLFLPPQVHLMAQVFLALSIAIIIVGAYINTQRG